MDFPPLLLVLFLTIEKKEEAFIGKGRTEMLLKIFAFCSHLPYSSLGGALW